MNNVKVPTLLLLMALLLNPILGFANALASLSSIPQEDSLLKGMSKAMSKTMDEAKSVTTLTVSESTHENCHELESDADQTASNTSMQCCETSCMCAQGSCHYSILALNLDGFSFEASDASLEHRVALYTNPSLSSAHPPPIF